MSPAELHEALLKFSIILTMCCINHLETGNINLLQTLLCLQQRRGTSSEISEHCPLCYLGGHCDIYILFCEDAYHVKRVKIISINFESKIIEKTGARFLNFWKDINIYTDIVSIWYNRKIISYFERKDMKLYTVLYVLF